MTEGYVYLFVHVSEIQEFEKIIAELQEIESDSGDTIDRWILDDHFACGSWCAQEGCFEPLLNYRVWRFYGKASAIDQSIELNKLGLHTHYGIVW